MFDKQWRQSKIKKNNILVFVWMYYTILIKWILQRTRMADEKWQAIPPNTSRISARMKSNLGNKSLISKGKNRVTWNLILWDSKVQFSLPITPLALQSGNPIGRGYYCCNAGILVHFHRIGPRHVHVHVCGHYTCSYSYNNEFFIHAQEIVLLYRCKDCIWWSWLRSTLSNSKTLPSKIVHTCNY